MTRTRRMTVLAAVAGLVVGIASALPAQAAPTSAPVVRVETGALQGVAASGVDSFRGIPYAAPPVGALRWQPPRRPATWSGVRDATHYGPRCAALKSSNGSRSESEDCLFVNVQRPTGTTAGAGLPVYVFIHGGGLVNGSSNQADGVKLARRGNGVVVSLNYRLGVFGFLGLAGLSHAGEGNYGFLDQQAALRWVRRNIAAFGGDPSRVTVGGESAGGFSVCGHLVASQGLFAQAMIQSGSCDSRPLDQTRSDSARFETAAGCTSLGCLRRASTATLLDASGGFSPTLTSGTSVFPVPTQQSLERGDIARVPVVNGSNRDEGRTFDQGAIGDTQAQYEAAVRANAGADAAQVLAHYPWPAHATKFTAAYLLGAIATDSGFFSGIGGCAALRTSEQLSRWVPTYAYEFDARHGPGLTPIPGYVWGAGHAAELAYLFPSFDNGTPIAPTFDAGERELSRNMIDYWMGFVSTGRPQAPGLASWPRFDQTGQLMSLRPGGKSTTISTAAFRAEHQCDFWDSLAG